MHFNDSEIKYLQRMIKQVELEYRKIQPQATQALKEYEKNRPLIEQAIKENEKNRPMVEIAEKNYEKNKPLIESIQKLAVQNIVENQTYFDDAQLQIIRDLERFQPLQKQIDQLKPLHSKLLQSLNDYSVSFKKSISTLDNSGINFGLSIEPGLVSHERKYAPVILVINLDDSESHGVPIEEISDIVSLPDIIQNITLEETLNFFNHLTKFPMLGLLHPVGNKILQGIENSPLTEISHLTLFRAHVWKETQSLPYSELEMFNAPYGQSEQGRFNVRGHGLLYACDALEGAIQEVENPFKRQLTIMQMTLNRKLKVFDLSGTSCPIYEKCHCQASDSNPSKHEYLIPNFIAQCCQKLRISGIKYTSTKDSQMRNYVLFEISSSWFDNIVIIP